MHCAYCGYAYKGHDEFGMSGVWQSGILRTPAKTPDSRTPTAYPTSTPTSFPTPSTGGYGSGNLSNNAGCISPVA